MAKEAIPNMERSYVYARIGNYLGKTREAEAPFQEDAFHHQDRVPRRVADCAGDPIGGFSAKGVG